MKKILIVDDDKDLREVLWLTFLNEGYEVVVSSTCADGLLTFYREEPDIVLLDINVHNEDGREMCKQIKSNAEYYHIPVILISGNSEALMTYKSYGATHAISKPFEMRLVAEIVRTYTMRF